MQQAYNALLAAFAHITPGAVLLRPPPVFNLANNIDVRETEAKLRAYESANRASILAIQARQVRPADVAPAHTLSCRLGNPSRTVC